MSKSNVLPVLLALTAAIAPAVNAAPFPGVVAVTAKQQDGRFIARISSDTTHPVSVQEILVPNAVKATAKVQKAASERKVMVGMPDANGVYQVDLGSVEQVFDAMGAKHETSALLLAEGRIPPGQCNFRPVPLRIILAHAGGLRTEGFTAIVEVQICNR